MLIQCKLSLSLSLLNSLCITLCSVDGTCYYRYANTSYTCVHTVRMYSIYTFVHWCIFNTDPNERAQDMIYAYQRECSNMRVKPVIKLMEQLEVYIH